MVCDRPLCSPSASRAQDRRQTPAKKKEIGLERRPSAKNMAADSLKPSPGTAGAADGASMPPRGRRRASERRVGPGARRRPAHAARYGTGRTATPSLTWQRPTNNDDAMSAVTIFGSFSGLARRGRVRRKCASKARSQAPCRGVGATCRGPGRCSDRATTCFRGGLFWPPRVVWPTAR